ncbi:DUF1428 domain-containing protein [Sphingomonas sp. AR_OL41]|jgi:uncharacterized protein YbaA (DUF1428 family)|uniref:DUF1428 domain-containing protein n=1 Tax=Sphingomonas sp. AR_OL41 TaxID=3042729 RepID=UPI002480DCAA|nr:DUF1428 domain-containing protein [Sphingomonas sp. AR_OL41]MDH7973504.1 DUF1428 domain-containing protein [Sphingomonas sp. AR_OL41]
MTYIDGFLAPVRAGTTREAYADFAEKAAPIFREHGATRVVEGWGDDIPDGKVTDFRRAVLATEGETVVFSWIEWPDKVTREAGMKKVMEDPRMQPGAEAMPFDGKRLIFGGFTAIVDA